MNSILTKGIIKSFLPTLTAKLPELDIKLQDFIAQQPLHDGEEQATLMVYVYNSKCYISIVALDSNNTIARQIQSSPLAEFIESLIAKM